MSMDDYWEDYEAYDTAVAELKESLVSSVKKEVKNKIHSLEEENKQLKQKVANLDKLEEQAEIKLRQAESEFKTASSRALRATAKELLLAMQEPAFMVEVKFVKKDKCDKCNEKRELPFTYPSGEPGAEACQCAKPQQKYVTIPAIGKEVDIKWWGGKREVIIWYRPYRLNDDEYGSVIGDTKERYDGRDFSEVDRYHTIFKDEATANKYSEYLNKQEKIKS